MKQKSKKSKFFHGALPAVFLIAFFTAFEAPAYAEPDRPVIESALRLVQFVNNSRAGLDETALANVVDFVLKTKQESTAILPETAGCPGAYHEFDAKIPFHRFIEYSFNSMIPQTVTRPSSLRYSLWRDAQGNAVELPNFRKIASSSGNPLILHGLQRDSNTPDLTTGVYYEYDLKRTLILTRHQGRQVIVSISKQIDRSKVGAKGFILGNDNDWNYYYSGEPGSAKSGLGWVKSYIYDYFSVSVYVESGTAPAKVRTGTLQWIRAGWSGMNFVRPSHIIEGMKRFAQNNRMILESPNLPAPERMITVYRWLLQLPPGELKGKYVALQQAQRASAIKIGKIDASEAGKPIAADAIPKEQMLDELMLEYLKLAIGKPTPLEFQLKTASAAI